ncbi:MAG: hypothetical protein JW862_14315 [Anaerolineales bacterium]|nr:hypothetical protein [Anaerolineales bacterium]
MKNQYKLLLIITTLAIAILACSFGGEELPEGVLFQDDFSNTSSGWDRVNIAGDGITDYENDQYRILVETTQTDVWANPGLDFTDTVIEVEATKVGGSDDNDFGVICRYQDTQNFYFFIISSDGYYGIGKVENGNQSQIDGDGMDYSDAIKQGNTTNDLRVDCIGNQLTLYVNGTSVSSATDSTFSSGDVGLLAGTFSEPGTDILFDNIVVRQP